MQEIALVVARAGHLPEERALALACGRHVEAVEDEGAGVVSAIAFEEERLVRVGGGPGLLRGRSALRLYEERLRLRQAEAPRRPSVAPGREPVAVPGPGDVRRRRERRARLCGGEEWQPLRGVTLERLGRRGAQGHAGPVRRPEEREVLRDRGEQGLGVQAFSRRPGLEAEARLGLGQTCLDGVDGRWREGLHRLVAAVSVQMDAALWCRPLRRGSLAESGLRPHSFLCTPPVGLRLGGVRVQNFSAVLWS